MGGWLVGVGQRVQIGDADGCKFGRAVVPPLCGRKLPRCVFFPER